jgi:hypothetical protein
MASQVFQIDDLHAPRGKAGENLGLARAGVAVDQDQVQAAGLVVEPRLHPPAIGLVAAAQHRRSPADPGEDGRHGIRPLAAAPAIDERPERGRLVGQGAFQVRGDVAGDIGRADAVGAKRRVLDIDRPDLGALFVAQHRQVDRARNMVLGIFAGAAHVDHRVERLQGGGVRGLEYVNARHVRPVWRPHSRQHLRRRARERYITGRGPSFQSAPESAECPKRCV